jgi:acetoin utilization protein AcuB
MLIKYWMKKDPVTIDVNDSMQKASDLMKETGAPFLNVLEDGKLVGVITDTNLKKYAALDATALKVFRREDLIRRVRAGEIMTKPPITVRPDWLLEEAADLLIKKKISGAPVVDAEGRLLGTISQTDLFSMLITFTAYHLHGVQFAFQMEDRPGLLQEVIDTIKRYGARVRNILISYEKAPAHYRYVYLRIYGYDRRVIPSMLAELREKTTILYMVNYRENERIEFVPRTTNSSEQ